MRGEPVSHTFLTPDHPEANGRKAQKGDVEYKAQFMSDMDELITIKMGQRGFDTHTQLMLDMLANMPGYDDGSLPK